jgi:hypothetical protein
MEGKIIRCHKDAVINVSQHFIVAVLTVCGEGAMGTGVSLTKSRGDLSKVDPYNGVGGVLCTMAGPAVAKRE